MPDAEQDTYDYVIVFYNPFQHDEDEDKDDPEERERKAKAIKTME